LVKPEDWPKIMATNLVSNNWIFLRYSITITFISNAIQLLDIPHHFIKFFKYMAYKQSQKKEIK
jgi:hypothetical protein